MTRPATPLQLISYVVDSLTVITEDKSVEQPLRDACRPLKVAAENIAFRFRVHQGRGVSSAPTLKAIPTKHNGVLFRSRLEARWAAMLDDLRVKWDYEPEGYDLDGVRYLPDFWLPEFNAFLEIKPSPASDIRKSRLLAKESGHDVFVGYGMPPRNHHRINEWTDGKPPDWILWIESQEVATEHHCCWITVCNCGKIEIRSRDDEPRISHQGVCSSDALPVDEWSVRWDEVERLVSLAHRRQFDTAASPKELPSGFDA